MKCAICKNKTTWDESFGHVDFIVCPKCFNEIHNHYDIVKTMDIIFTLGDITKNMKKQNKKLTNSQKSVIIMEG